MNPKQDRVAYWQAERERLARSAARSCGGCRACCTIQGVVEIEKPANQPCRHECEAGCAIYDRRPSPCASYLCLWRQGWGTDEMRPDRSRYLFDIQTQPALFLFAHGFEGKPPAIMVVRYLESPSVFEEESYRSVRDRLIGNGAAVVEVLVDSVRIFGLRHLEGVVLPVDAPDLSATTLSVKVPESDRLSLEGPGEGC